MKYALLLLTFIGFIWAFMVGIDKEAVRQCEVAQAHCEQYGACSPVDLAICEGK